MINKVIIIGRVGRDPELKHMPTGTAICNLSVATTEKWVDKSGAKQEKTEWHRVVIFGKIAESTSQYVNKGSLVYVSGSLSTKSWESDGVTKYATEVKAKEIKFLDSKKEEYQSAPSSDEPFSADDCPF